MMVVVKQDSEPKTDQRMIQKKKNTGAVALEGKESAPLTLTTLTHDERQPTHQIGDCTYTHIHTLTNDDTTQLQ